MGAHRPVEASLPASRAQILPRGNVRGDVSGLFPKRSLESRMEECVRLAAAACSLLFVPLLSHLPLPPSPPPLFSPHTPSSLPAPLPRAEFTAISPKRCTLGTFCSFPVERSPRLHEPRLPEDGLVFLFHSAPRKTC